MFFNLACLAMNTNLTAKEFSELSEKAAKRHVEMIQTMAAEAQKLPPDLRAQYIAQCLPLIL